MKELLKYSIFVGIWLLLILPFIVANNQFFPYITGKAFTFRIIVEILLGLWLIMIVKYKEFRPRESWLLLSTLIFTAVMFVADIFAVDPFKAIWSNFERMEGWVTIAHLFVYFLILGSMFDTAKIWSWFFRSQVLAGMVLAFVSIDNGGEVRFSGPLGNPIYISVYFLFIFFFSLILLYRDVFARHLSDWNSFQKIFVNTLFYVYIATALVSLFAVYRTSRGVLLGAVGGMIVTFILIAIFEKEKKVLKQISLGILIAIILAIGTFISFRDSNYVKKNPTLSRLAEVSWSNVNGQARQYVWPMAIEGFKERPILGWGQDGFNHVFNKYYDPRMYGQEPWFDRAHNAPLDFLVAGGILGLLSYLSLFAAALYMLWSRRNLDLSERAILTGLIAGYFFQALFVFDNLMSYVLFFTVLAYVHARSVENRELHKSLDKEIGDDYQNYVLVPIIMIVTAGLIYFVNVPGIMANRTLINAMRITQTESLVQGLETFKKALSYNSIGTTEIREQLLSYAYSIFQAKEIPNQNKVAFIDAALAEFDKQIASVPEDARSYILVGNFLNNLGQPALAIPKIEKAIELSPKKQQMRFELIRALANTGQMERAQELAKETYELEPKYDQAKKVYETVLQFKINGQK
jgi:O-antigen ligase